MLKFVFILLTFYFQINGITFYAQDGKEKCFSDEIPSRSVVIVYHSLKSDGVPSEDKKAKKPPGVNDVKERVITEGLELRVYDPADERIESHLVNPGPNKFSFTSGQMGRYRFCIFKGKSFWKQGEYKYSIKIQQGVDFNLQDAANKTHVMNLQERIDGLTNRTKDFISLQQLNREQEDKLTTQSILINQRVVQTTIVQTIVLMVSGIYQIWSLRRFFKQRFLL